MKRSEDLARVLTTIGDINPTDHCGGWVYEDTSGQVRVVWVEAPHWESDWDCPECKGGGRRECECEYEDTCSGTEESTCVACRGTGNDSDLRWEVYETTADEHDVDDWDWDAIASYTGIEGGGDAYREIFRKGDKAAMGWAMHDVASYHGWHELDSSPVYLKRWEADELEADMDRAERETKQREDACAQAVREGF